VANSESNDWRQLTGDGMFDWSLRLIAGGLPVAQRRTRPLLAQLGHGPHFAGAKCDTSTMPSWGGSDGAYLAPTAPAHPSPFLDELAFQRLAAAGSFTLCMPPSRPPSQPISQARCQPAVLMQLLCASSAARTLRTSPSAPRRTIDMSNAESWLRLPAIAAHHHW
jgi:hypothetical protein